MGVEQAKRARYRVRDAEPRDVPALARVHVASWHHAYAGIISDLNLAATHERRSLARFRAYFVTGERRRSFMQVVEGESGVVGYVNGGASVGGSLRARGEIFELYLLPEVQGQGLGQMLFSAGLWRLAGARAMPAVVWVLADNRRARRFYARMRGQVCARGTAAVGDQRLRKVAYRWADYLPWPSWM